VVLIYAVILGVGKPG